MTAMPRTRIATSVPTAPGGAVRESYLLLLAQVFRRLCGGDVEEPEGQVVGCPRCGRHNRVPAAGSGVPVCGNCRHALPWIAAADDDDFAEVAEQSSVPVLVGMWAPWCGFSCLVRPVLEELTLTRPGELKLVEVEVSAAPQTTRRLAVRALPMLLVLRGGEVVARHYGFAEPTPELRDWLDGTLAALRQEASPGTVTTRA